MHTDVVLCLNIIIIDISGANNTFQQALIGHYQRGKSRQFRDRE